MDIIRIYVAALAGAAPQDNLWYRAPWQDRVSRGGPRGARNQVRRLKYMHLRHTAQRRSHERNPR